MDHNACRLRKTEKGRLRIFERKVLRKYELNCMAAYHECGRDVQGWRKKLGQGVMDAFKTPRIVNEIKRSELELTCRARRKHNSLIKRVLQ